MPSIDLSRNATDFRKHYTGVRLGQGQLLTDEAFNEAGRLDYEDLRKTRVHTIGPAGSPDDGFSISAPVVAGGKIDFTINPGTMYLGGLRLTLEPRIAPDKETFRTQRDWLRVPVPGPDLTLALAPNQTRRDFAFLEAWIQPVSSVEDGENFEVAIGTDAAWRNRAMRRVRVLPGVGNAADCTTALQQAATALGGTLNEDNEVVVDTQLTVIYDGGNQTDDLCSPKVKAGYLGAENQAIRVQLTSPNTFTWGFDNAAPLYKVRVSPDAGVNPPYVVTVDTEPKDQFHWPLHGMLIELLPWAAVLPNETDAAGAFVRAEKVAELSGHYARVDGAYDPDTRTFTAIDLEPVAGVSLANGVPNAFGEEWTARPDAPKLGPGFYFMRVWNRGDDVATPPHIPIANVALPAPNDSTPLGTTGLRVKITGAQKRARDYWIIAARPETSDDVVPWQLESGRPPHGVHRYIAALGIIEWTADAGGVISATLPVHDCRPTFLPLTRIRSCCSYTVGDGVSSVGHYKMIQDAIDALPPEGGEVCVLPGHYAESVLIQGRQNVTVHGCGPRSEVTAAATAKNPLGPVFTISGSKGITLERLGLIADAGFAGVSLPGSNPARDIKLIALDIEAGPQCGIEADGIDQLLIRDCNVLMRDVFGPCPAIFCRGERMEILHNFVSVKSPRFAYGGSVVGARGGIQIGGGSNDVRIIDNLIVGGLGNGITLGSLKVITGDGKGRRIYVIGGDDDPCHPGDGHVVVIVIPGEGPTRVESEGPLSDILIERNRIYRMGLNGIGVAGFFDVVDATKIKGIGSLIGSAMAKKSAAKRAKAKQGSTSDIFAHVAKSTANYQATLKADYAGISAGQAATQVEDLFLDVGLTRAALQDSEMIRISHLYIIGNWIVGCLNHELAPIQDAMAPYMGYGGISLADCRYLVIRDNLIAKNGLSWLDPICGIFVLAASALEIDRNHVVDNGPASSQSQANAGQGPRAGIHVTLATPMSASEGALLKLQGRHFEMPAATIHGNTVVQPLGRALLIAGYGNMSVLGNYFESQAVELRGQGGNGACVSITDIGFTHELPATVAGSLALVLNDIASGAAGNTSLTGLCKLLPKLIARSVGPSRETPSGKVLFDDNQLLFAVESERGSAVIGARIMSLDDVGCSDNQIECQFDTPQPVLDIVAVGLTLRAVGNRFSDSFQNQLQLSGVTAGLLNTTSLNQSTWCLSVRGPSNAAGIPRNDVVVGFGNTSLVELFCPGACGRKRGVGGAGIIQEMGKMIAGAKLVEEKSAPAREQMAAAKARLPFDADQADAMASQVVASTAAAYEQQTASMFALRLTRLAQMHHDVESMAEDPGIADLDLAAHRAALAAEVRVAADWLRLQRERPVFE